MMLTAICLTLGATAIPPVENTASPSAVEPAVADLVIFADVLYTGTGSKLENAAVTIAGGKIAAFVGGKTPGNSDVHVSVITPGLVDLNASVNDGARSVEEAFEITPSFRVANTLDPFDIGWDRQLRSGVTTVVAHPYDNNCIGGLSVAVKTGGERSIEARTVKADVALRGAQGTQPSRGNHPPYGPPQDFYSRRPTTRMGVEWEWRKAMYDALHAEGKPERAFDGLEQLTAVLNGELPVIAQAWATQDIRTMIFVKEEMAREGKPKMRVIIDGGAEAWREPDLLVRSGAAVILSPYAHGGRTNDSAFYALDTAKKLHELGVPIAFTSYNSANADARLAQQVAYARRGGLPFDAALAAVTIKPAQLVGIDDRVGSIEVGKDADFALWNGTPFELTSRVVGVVLDGDLVVDPR